MRGRHVHMFCALVACSALLQCTTGAEPPAAYEPDPCGRAIELAREASLDLSTRFAGPCTVDEDCAVDFGTVVCPDSPALDTGEVAYSRLVSDAYEAAKATAESEMCALKCGGGFNVDNFIAYAYCRDGVCQGTYPAPEDRCGRIALNATSLLEGAFPDHSCRDAQDCALFATDLPCPEFGHVIVGCSVALPVARADEVPGALATIGQRSCNDFGYTCNFHSECEPVEADCIDGHCVAKAVP